MKGKREHPYDGSRNVRDEERRLNSKSGWKPWKPTLRNKAAERVGKSKAVGAAGKVGRE